METRLRRLIRPLARRTISLIEPVVGFRTDPTGHLLLRVKMIFGRYEPFLFREICRALPTNGTFADIGANVGFFSHQIARRFPKARVVAFEPNPRIYPLLHQNLSAFSNGLAFQMGLGAREGVLEFFHGEESCVGSFVQEYTSQHPSNSLRGQIKKCEVTVATGDAMLADAGTIDVIKMDVEGYESQVLKGMSHLLHQRAIKTIFFEFCPFAQKCAGSQPEEIVHLLINSGYVIAEMEGQNEGALVSAENVRALVTRLGGRGYTTLRADLRPGRN